MMYPCTSSPKPKTRRAMLMDLKKNPAEIIPSAKEKEKYSHFLIVSIVLLVEG
jgi:hypothetical protein